MPLDGDLVIVIDPAQVGELEMTRKGCCLAGDPLHHAAIATQGIDVVIENLEASAIVGTGQPPASDCHSDAGRHPLA